jgi:hypothetical protein
MSKPLIVGFPAELQPEGVIELQKTDALKTPVDLFSIKEGEEGHIHVNPKFQHWYLGDHVRPIVLVSRRTIGHVTLNRGWKSRDLGRLMVGHRTQPDTSDLIQLLQLGIKMPGEFLSTSTENVFLMTDKFGLVCVVSLRFVSQHRYLNARDTVISEFDLEAGTRLYVRIPE